MDVAAWGSVPTVVALADDFVARPEGAGVSVCIRNVFERGAIMTTPKRRAVLLGTTAYGSEVTLASSGTNVVVSGDPRSGKSWMAGLLSEQLIEEGYQVCIIDPEGDYSQMGQRPKVVTFGHDFSFAVSGRRGAAAQQRATQHNIHTR